MLGAVKVGKDKGNLIIGDAGAVATAAFAFGGKNIQQFIVQHHAEEFAGLGRKLIIELATHGKDLIRCADGLGIAGAEFQRVIGKAHRIFFAQTLRLLAINAVRHRHQILHNRLAKLLYIFLGVAVAAHAVVSQRGITFIAQLFAHFITQMHQLIVKIIQLSLVFFVPIALGFPCSEATGIVRVTLKRSELRKGVYTALKRDLSRSQQLFILIGQLIFFLQFFNNHRREGLALDFRLEEHQVAVLFGKVLTVRRFQHGLGPALLALLQLGVNLVPELHFSIIKSIAGINGVANMGKIRQGADVLIQLFLCQEQFFRLSIAFRCFQLFSQAIQLSFQLLSIRALIFHLGKFHSEVLLVVRYYNNNAFFCSNQQVIFYITQ